MEFLVLGPLEVRRDGQAIEMRGAKRRALLALLILHANEVIRNDRLADALWGDDPPENASAALQSHVSRLRKDLGGDVLVTKPWGYVLRADPQDVDLRRFEALVSEARTLAAHERRAKLGEALALWRGHPLADLANEPALTADIGRLEELRLSALEQRFDADLELGGDSGLVAELESAVALHPLRERLRGQLILALYRAGRQAEALETYRETRRVLVEELGIEPSPELRELEQAILRQDPALTSWQRAASEDVGATPPYRPSRWWPKTGLAAAAALLLGGGGALAALLVARDGPSNGSAAALPSTATTTVAVTRQVTTSPPATTHARLRERRPITATVVAVTTVAPTVAKTTGPAHTVTHTATHAKPPAQPGEFVYWLSDDFTDPAVDYGLWHIAGLGSGTNVAERNARLELSIAPDAVLVNNGIDRHYGTNCLVQGDFDTSVEFELLDWPDGAGMSVSLGAYFPPPFEYSLGVARSGSSSNAPESYNTNIGSEGVQTGDAKGALRLQRMSGVVRSYYRYRGSWVKIGSAFYERRGANLTLNLGTNGDAFGHKAAAVAFDNFHATADWVTCNNVPLPPRKPKR